MKSRATDAVDTSTDGERCVAPEVERHAAPEGERNSQQIGVVETVAAAVVREDAEQAEHGEHGAEHRVEHPRVELAEPLARPDERRGRGLHVGKVTPRRGAHIGREDDVALRLGVYARAVAARAA